jgi:hypothetical protein
MELLPYAEESTIFRLTLRNQQYSATPDAERCINTSASAGAWSGTHTCYALHVKPLGRSPLEPHLECSSLGGSTQV